MKINAKNSSVKSMRLMVPIDGLIDIDANGVADVSEACAEVLINCTNDWEKLESGEKPEEKLVEQSDKNESSVDDEIISGLMNLSLDDCVETAKQAGYPEKEWLKLSKNEKSAEKLMRNYLVKKYKISLK